MKKKIRSVYLNKLNYFNNAKKSKSMLAVVLKSLTVLTFVGALGACAQHAKVPVAADNDAQKTEDVATAYSLAPTPAFAGATTTVAGDNQTYYFGFDKSKLTDADLASIQAQANYLLQHPKARVRLEGNTDERGSREYNIGLGYRRDQSVDAILQQDGVTLRQIVMISYGKERPAIHGNNEDAWAKNRRVNLIYEVK